MHTPSLAPPSDRRRSLGQPPLVAALFLALLLGGLGLRGAVGHTFTFLGSDSYAYMGAACELWQHHHYRFRAAPWHRQHPTEEPGIGYGRPPGYAAFLAVLVRPVGDDYAAFPRIIKPVQWVLDIGTCVLVFAIASQLGGPFAAWPAFLLALLNPFLILYSNAVLTETLATFLVTLTFFLCSTALRSDAQRARRALLAAGVVMGLATLVRVDSLFLLCILPLLLVPRLRPCTLPARAVLAAALAVGLVYGPWLARNWLVAGRPYPLGQLQDVRGRELTHTAYFSWFATWVEREDQLAATLYCLARPSCVASVATYPAAAFDSAADRAELSRLFALRAQAGMTPEVDAGFRALLTQRIARSPLRRYLWLPLRRAFHLWVNANDQPLRSMAQSQRWPTLSSRAHTCLLPVKLGLDLLGCLGLLLVLFGRSPSGRRLALLFATALLGRTAALSLTGLVEARYLLELAPVLLSFAGAAAGLGLRFVLDRRHGRTGPG
ncbi:MAG: glycosyltransferase family 39 protein [Myxococcales bacterium]|nr:glycosyltransferase family 39 protein [Myxococcales bacterium]